MKISAKRVLCALLAALVCLFAATSSVYGRTVAAASDYASFDETPIEDDMADVDVLQYPKNPLGKATLISFQEYCYSDKAFLQEAYGLYVYVYNPTEKELKTDALANSVEMAVKYDADGFPEDYEQFAMIFLDCTDNCRFYKFKIAATSHFRTMATEYSKAHDGIRRYDVSSIQLWAEGENTSTDYPVSLTYRWTGYAENCGEYMGSESTLECTADDLVTLEIPLHHTNEAGEEVTNQTYYRTGKSSLGANHQWQIDTVYFSVDEDDLFHRAGEDLGILQKIKAKWYEYQTQPIYVTSSKELKEAFTPYIGVDISSMSTQDVFNIGYGFGDFAKYIGGLNGDDCFYWDWAYAVFQAPFYTQGGFTYNGYTNNVREVVNQIDWLFQVENAGANRVTTEELLSYAEDYSKKYGVSSDRYLKLLGFSDALFTDGTAIHGDGKEVKRGENELEFDTDATFDLKSYDSTLSGWDRFLNWWYGVDNGTEWEINDFKPIVEVTEGDISSIYGDGEVGEALKLNERDVPEFRKWADKEIKDGKKVYLFRFAVTDYTQEVLHVQRHGNCSGAVSTTEYPISRAQQAVFLGFEILTVTYNNNGKLTVIPVVQSPIHVFDDVDVYLQEKPPLEWWQIVLAVVLVVLLLVLLWKFLPWIFQAIIWVIMLPFKLIAALCKAISNCVKKRRRKKEEEEQQAQQNEQAERPV